MNETFIANSLFITTQYTKRTDIAKTNLFQKDPDYPKSYKARLSPRNDKSQQTHAALQTNQKKEKSFLRGTTVSAREKITREPRRQWPLWWLMVGERALTVRKPRALCPRNLKNLNASARARASERGPPLVAERRAANTCCWMAGVPNWRSESKIKIFSSSLTILFNSTLESVKMMFFKI